MDLIVTTPKSAMAAAAQEAADVFKANGGEYFRKIPYMPLNTDKGDRLWYVEDGALRGYAVISRFVETGEPQVCDTTGRVWDPGRYVFVDARSWVWIHPIPMKGFQGLRYFEFNGTPRIIGNWQSPRPRIREDGEWCQYDTEEDCDYHVGCGYHT